MVKAIRKPGTPDLSRRNFLRAGATVAAGVGLAGSGLLTACASGPAPAAGSNGADPTDVNLQLSWIQDVEFAGTYIGLEKGLFSSRGVNLTMLPGGPNVSVVSQVISGQALVGNGKNLPDIASAVAQGAPLRAIGALYQKNPLAMVYLQDNPVPDPQAMVGKRVGIPGNDHTIFNLFCKINNVDPAKVQVVPVQFDPSPLVNKEVDLFLGFAASIPVQLTAKGIANGHWLLADFGYAAYNGTYYTLESTLQEKKDLLVAFMKAELAGWEQNIADPALGARLTVDKYGKSLGLNYDTQLAGNNIYVNELMQNDVTKAKGLAWMDEASIERNLATCRGLGIKAEPSLFNTEILQGVYGGGNRVQA